VDFVFLVQSCNKVFKKHYCFLLKYIEPYLMFYHVIVEDHKSLLDA